jgi:hypothetical protein
VSTVYEKGEEKDHHPLRVDKKLTKLSYRKKKRHFSQENSFQEEEHSESLEREIKEKRLFSELNQILNAGRVADQERKTQGKKAGSIGYATFSSGKGKSDLSKVALTLE